QHGEYPAIQPPQCQAHFGIKFRLSAALGLLLLELQGRHGDPGETTRHQGGNQHEGDHPTTFAMQPFSHVRSPSPSHSHSFSASLLTSCQSGPAMYPWARTVTMASEEFPVLLSWNLPRSRAMCMSMVRVSTPCGPMPQSRVRSSSRDTARCRCV